MSEYYRPLRAAGGWVDRAACRDSVDPDIFFAGDDDAVAVWAAKQYCRSCPVVEECLDWATENGEEYGIFGGLTAGERLRLKRGFRVCSECRSREARKDRGTCSSCMSDRRRRRARAREEQAAALAAGVAADLAVPMPDPSVAEVWRRGVS